MSKEQLLFHTAAREKVLRGATALRGTSAQRGDVLLPGAMEPVSGSIALALHTLDIVISDAPVPPGSNVRAFNHLLGDTGVSFFYRRGFPGGLDGAPFLLPLENSTLRRSLNQWFDRHAIRPRVVAEFEDSTLLKVFGADGAGIFPAPTVMEADVSQQYGVRVLGRAPEVRERFYAISVE